jgi:hypothetical protein
LCGQTTGATPLCIASEMGHVEAVRALVELGAALNQATVGLLEVSFGVDSVYLRARLRFVRMSVVVGRGHARVYGVWCVVVDKGGETRLTLSVHTRMRGWLCMWSA